MKKGVMFLLIAAIGPATGFGLERIDMKERYVNARRIGLADRQSFEQLANEIAGRLADIQTELGCDSKRTGKEKWAIGGAACLGIGSSILGWFNLLYGGAAFMGAGYLFVKASGIENENSIQVGDETVYENISDVDYTYLPERVFQLKVIESLGGLLAASPSEAAKVLRSVRDLLSKGDRLDSGRALPRLSGDDYSDWSWVTLRTRALREGIGYILEQWNSDTFRTAVRDLIATPEDYQKPGSIGTWLFTSAVRRKLGVIRDLPKNHFNEVETEIGYLQASADNAAAGGSRYIPSWGDSDKREITYVRDRLMDLDQIDPETYQTKIDRTLQSLLRGPSANGAPIDLGVR